VHIHVHENILVLNAHTCTYMHTSARFARQSPRHLAFIAALLAATPSRSRQGRSGGRARTPRYAAWSARWLASQCLCIHTHSMLLYMLANGCVYASVCAHSFVVHKNTEVNRQDNCGMCSHTRTPKEWFETDPDSRNDSGTCYVFEHRIHASVEPAT
jgi:hypothetical protein